MDTCRSVISSSLSVSSWEVKEGPEASLIDRPPRDGGDESGSPAALTGPLGSSVSFNTLSTSLSPSSSLSPSPLLSQRASDPVPSGTTAVARKPSLGTALLPSSDPVNKHQVSEDVFMRKIQGNRYKGTTAVDSFSHFRVHSNHAFTPCVPTSL